MGSTGMHKTLPGRAVNPDEQGWQVALPPTLKEKVLAGHAVQAVAVPPAEPVPEAHERHAPVVDRYWPAAQPEAAGAAGAAGQPEAASMVAAGQAARLR